MQTLFKKRLKLTLAIMLQILGNLYSTFDKSCMTQPLEMTMRFCDSNLQSRIKKKKKKKAKFRSD